MRKLVYKKILYFLLLATPLLQYASPDDMTDKLKWESANPEIAQVQSNEPGLVSGIIGLKVGTTTITASTADGRVKQSLPVRLNVKVT